MKSIKINGRLIKHVHGFLFLTPDFHFVKKVNKWNKKNKSNKQRKEHKPQYLRHRFILYLLIILVVSILALWAYGMLSIELKPWEIFAILFTFISFGFLGLYDDFKKLMNSGKKHAFFGLRFRYKFLIQWILALIIASVLYTQLGYDFIFIRGYGLASLGFLFIPLAAFVIVSFTNAFNIADGLDGLAPGLLLICLGAFLAISADQLDETLKIFIAILMGSVSAFLYFNIYKARIWLGDVGSLSLGAVLAVSQPTRKTPEQILSNSIRYSVIRYLWY